MPGTSLSEQAKPIVFHSEGKKTFVDGEWPPVAIIGVGSINHEYGKVAHCGEALRIEVENGYAVYQHAEYVPHRNAWLCRLISSERKVAL